MFDGAYSIPSRFQDAPGTNPEELIGAAHAGCRSMALAAGLTKAGHAPNRIPTAATVHLDRAGEGFAITRIDPETEAEVPGIDEDRFRKEPDAVKRICRVSRALAGLEIGLKAVLP